MAAHYAHLRVARRGFVRSTDELKLQKAAVTSSTTAVPASKTSEATEPVVEPLPDSVRALAGAITVLGLVIIAIAAWKFRSWRRRRIAAASSLQGEEKSNSEKSNRSSLSKEPGGDVEMGYHQYPSKAVIAGCPVPPVPEIGTGWVPQIRPVSGTLSLPAAAVPSESAQKKTSRSPRLKQKLRATIAFGFNARQLSPPPSYFVASRNTPSSSAESSNESLSTRRGLPPVPPLPRVATPPPRPSSIVRPPTPPTSLKLKNMPNMNSVAPPVIQSPMRTVSSKPPALLPFKKLSIPPSYDTSQPHHSSNSVDSSRFSEDSAAPKRFPRLVNVVNVFPPSQPDELSIKVGDVLRLLEEYEDEWCLVQRVGRHDGEKGVVPRFCLEYRSEIIPPRRLTLSLGTLKGGILF